MSPTSASPRSQGAVIAALLLFFPLGLCWMWRDRTWRGGLRWLVTTAAVFLVLTVALQASLPQTLNAHQAAVHTDAATGAPTTATAASPRPTPAATTRPSSAPSPAATASPAATDPPRSVTVNVTVPVTVSVPITMSVEEETVTAVAGSAPPASGPSPAAPAGNLCGAPANPYGLNYCGRGSRVTSPPADVCSYFSCIGNFAKGTGYLDECRDEKVTLTGGRPGACAEHGGELRAVTY